MTYFRPPNKTATEDATTLPEVQDQDRIRMDAAPSRSVDTRSVDTDISIAQKMLSAVSGSVLTSLLVTPLDVVRVRLQAQPSPSSAPLVQPSNFTALPPNLGVSACCREVFWVPNQSQFCVASSSPTVLDEMLISECAAEETQRRTFNSTLDGLRKIARNEGVLTLWRGLSPTLAMAVPANVIYFAGYDWLRTGEKSPMMGRVSDTYAPLVAGSTARVLAAIVVSPVEMLRTRMQASQSKSTTGVFKETVSGLSDMVSEQGYRSLWRGLSLTLWRDVPFSALYWWGYEYGRDTLASYRDGARGRGLDLSETSTRRRSRARSEEDHATLLTDSFIAGASSGAIAALVTTPFDVGKTRQQTSRHAK
ncbi:Carrier protein, mitochondrial, partial [Elasticomyces elasticus]